MTCIFNITFCISIIQVFIHFPFLLSVLLKLLKHIKLIVKCELLLENKIEKRTSFLIKKVVERFDKK